MFLQFFTSLRDAQVPVTLREYLTLMEALDADLADQTVENFYYLSRAALVKDERNLDKFDRVFGTVFKGLENLLDAMDKAEIPEEWLKKLAEKYLTEEEKKQIEAMGWDKLMETLRKRLEEQKGRHQGGNKWIGTAGTSPFGAHGYNPEGVRIGQEKNRNNRAVKVWDRREFKDLDGNVELGIRNIKIALRRLRKFARTGAPDELDLDTTIKETANHGYLDVIMRPERRNAVKVLVFFDIGGSMDSHIEQVEELFSAAKTEFKHMEYFYFHNCLYEGVWKQNKRRFTDRTPTWDVLHKYPHDYKVVFVGDASMSPYEIMVPGGSVEHVNEEAGSVWLDRIIRTYPHAVWLNPVAQKHWDYSESTTIIRRIFSQRMYPITIEGLEGAMKELVRYGGRPHGEEREARRTMRPQTGLHPSRRASRLLRMRRRSDHAPDNPSRHQGDDGRSQCRDRNAQRRRRDQGRQERRRRDRRHPRSPRDRARRQDSRRVRLHPRHAGVLDRSGLALRQADLPGRQEIHLPLRRRPALGARGQDRAGHGAEAGRAYRRRLRRLARRRRPDRKMGTEEEGLTTLRHGRA